MKSRKIWSLLLCLALLFGCVSFAAQAAGSDGRTPSRVVCTFYGDAGTTRAFHWFTKEACASQVKIGGRVVSGTAGKAFQGGYAHAVVVDGLTPGASYSYQVGDGTSWSAEGQFAASAGAGASSGFVALADVQASTAEEFTDSAKLLGRAWALLNNDKGFYVHLGDYTNNSDNTEWDYYFQAFAPYATQMTHAPVAGNHDGALKWNWFANMFTLKQQPGSVNLTGTYYSFDDGDAHYAVLNTNDMYPMSMQQYNWLQNDLRQSGAKWKILFLHKGPFSAGNHVQSSDVVVLRNMLLPLIESLGVDLVMSGHDHVYYRSEPTAGGSLAGAERRTTADLPGGAALRAALGGGGTAVSYQNPRGPIFILPDAGGPKRYQINSSLPSLIRTAAAECFQPGQSVYTTVTIQGNDLTYRAYVFDAAADKDVLFDQITVTKTAAPAAPAGGKLLPTDYITTLPLHLWHIVSAIYWLLAGAVD
ncbi:MAG: metallophosphoesterase family protein [Oscillospiraceae bacterium]|nr:metallophosphoesterase family protein [Oscillospiraceae bacterium]